MTDRINRNLLSSLVGEHVTTLKISSGSEKGDNVAGSLKSIKLTTESGKVHNIVIKLAPESSPAILSYIVNSRVMEVENYFYSTILNKIRSLINEHETGPDPCSENLCRLPFPKHFEWAEGSDVFLALEDLRPSGYRMANKYAGLTWEETSLALSAIAKFHALSHCLIREQGEKIFSESELALQLVQFPWYPRQMDPKYFPGVTGIFTCVIDVVKKYKMEVGKKMESIAPQFPKLFPGIYNKTDVEYFPVICHGDLWVNNILFKYHDDDVNEVSVPIDVQFIDLQQVHRGNIFEDLMYFFVTSTTPEFRKKHLLSALKVYYDSFSRVVSDLKHHMPLNFSYGFLIDNYFKNLINISVFVGGAIAFQLGSVDEEDSTEEIKTDVNINVIEKKEVDPDIIFLQRFSPKDLMPLGEHYAGLGDFCASSLMGDHRAVDRFLDVMQEFNDLGVFS